MYFICSFCVIVYVLQVLSLPDSHVTQPKATQKLQQKFVTYWETFKGIFNVIFTYLRHCVTRKKKAAAVIFMNKCNKYRKKDAYYQFTQTRTHTNKHAQLSVCVCVVRKTLRNSRVAAFLVSTVNNNTLR